MSRVVSALFAMVLLIVLGYAFQVPLRVFGHQALRTALPCTVPIRYSIGSLDERFGIERAEALRAIEAAEAVWEEGSGRDLLVHDTEQATLTIDFLYDERQERTELLNALDVEIESTLESYNNLEQRYETAEAAYASKEVAFERDRALYEARAARYEEAVESWNARGGAPARAYAELEEERRSLEKEARRLSDLAEEVNTLAREANALGAALNRLAERVNARADEYNAEIGEGEFEEAVYESSPGRESITVFEYGDTTDLIRVLAHEFGHAIGIDHVTDTEAIMYKLNVGTSLELSAADLAELEAACRTPLDYIQ